LARGVTKRSTWKKGDPRAAAAGRKSSRALPEDLRSARLINATLFEDTIYKYMGLSVSELELLLKDKSIPARDMVVVRILALALQNGDIARLNFLLERTIGKVADKLDLRAAVIVKPLHEQIVEEIEKNELTNS
jgi:hypothetical protein